MRVIRQIFMTILLLSLMPVPLFAASALFENLQQRLINDGLDPNLVQMIYGHPATQIEPRIVAVNIKRQEKNLNYNQFLSDYAVNKAKRYMDSHRHILTETHDRFGVDPPIVVAILTVETSLGTYTGRFKTINVLSTMAVAKDSSVLEQILDSVTPCDEHGMQTRKSLLPKIKKRADRSYRELKALIRYIQKNGIDPFSIKGSSEGAIGIPQFLPSNIAYYGQDGNRDGRIDLFDHDDAIASVAAFLKAHQWGHAQKISDKKRVIFNYNHSRYYVDKVYALAERLECQNPVLKD